VHFPDYLGAGPRQAPLRVRGHGGARGQEHCPPGARLRPLGRGDRLPPKPQCAFTGGRRSRFEPGEDRSRLGGGPCSNRGRALARAAAIWPNALAHVEPSASAPVQAPPYAARSAQRAMRLSPQDPSVTCSTSTRATPTRISRRTTPRSRNAASPWRSARSGSPIST
jgi:hypothetical protein